jgi:hypothetical protein
MRMAPGFILPGFPWEADGKVTAPLPATKGRFPAMSNYMRPAILVMPRVAHGVLQNLFGIPFALP